MTVSRKVEVTYDCADKSRAAVFEDMIRRLVMRPDPILRVTGQAFSSEPVIPSPEPLVEPR